MNAPRSPKVREIIKLNNLIKQQQDELSHTLFNLKGAKLIRQEVLKRAQGLPETMPRRPEMPRERNT